jgi:hypothetical protein
MARLPAGNGRRHAGPPGFQSEYGRQARHAPSTGYLDEISIGCIEASSARRGFSQWRLIPFTRLYSRRFYSGVIEIDFRLMELRLRGFHLRCRRTRVASAVGCDLGRRALTGSLDRGSAMWVWKRVSAATTRCERSVIAQGQEG